MSTSDYLGRGLDALRRLGEEQRRMVVEYLEALAELYPQRQEVTFEECKEALEATHHQVAILWGKLQVACKLPSAEKSPIPVGVLIKLMIDDESPYNVKNETWDKFKTWFISTFLDD